METVPGDCATRIIAYKNTQGTVITDADIQAERKLRGLDGAVYERWGNWVYGLVTEGDLGFSCEKRAPVQQVLGNRFLISLAVCGLGLLFAYSLALPLGVISAIIMTQPLVDHDPQHSAGEKFGRSLGLVTSKIFEALLRIVSYLGVTQIFDSGHRNYPNMLAGNFVRVHVRQPKFNLSSLLLFWW